jgi:hypothetical protein
VRSGVISVGVAIGVSALAGLSNPAAGATQARPRAGYFAGQEADGSTLMPVHFSVSKNRKKVVAFTAQAIAKAGCTRQLQSVQAPLGPMPIRANGQFRASSTTYPTPGIRVTVTGTFTSPIRARGHIMIHYANGNGCNANRLFTAVRTGASAPPPTD